MRILIGIAFAQNSDSDIEEVAGMEDCIGQKGVGWYSTEK